MPVALKDHLVSFDREESIAATALAWRKEAGHENSAEFNIVKFIEDVLAKKFKRKGQLTIEFFDMIPGDDPAFVTFQPAVTLHVDREIWELAKLGDPKARYILAHEIGHILLHDHHAKAFASEPNSKLYVKETSAEWQANTFAAYFLVPDALVLAHLNASELSASCSVTRTLATERIEVVTAARRPRPKIEGDFCIDCGNFVERRAAHVCDPSIRRGGSGALR
jgi:Zn-dependent peptidase ImmA (M78 family)